MQALEEQREEKKKSNIFRKRWVIALVVSLSGVLLIGGYALAKYYANNANKGVAAAADYYFTGNLLRDTSDGLIHMYNTSAWDGTGAYTFEVFVQNYKNQLLYNGENLDITYDITFSLEESDGGIYQVQYENSSGNQVTHTLQIGAPLTLQNYTLDGGTANSDSFSVIFTPPANIDDDYVSKGVTITARITSPNYLQGREIGSILHAGIVSAEYSLQANYTFISELVQAADWTTFVENMAGFPYEITYRPGATDTGAHDIQLQWDSNYIVLNQFDENIAQVATSGTTQTLTISVSPYETVNLVFYRSDNFSSISTLDDFRQLITVTDLSKTP